MNGRFAAWSRSRARGARARSASAPSLKRITVGGSGRALAGPTMGHAAPRLATAVVRRLAETGGPWASRVGSGVRACSILKAAGLFCRTAVIPAFRTRWLFLVLPSKGRRATPLGTKVLPFLLAAAPVRDSVGQSFIIYAQVGMAITSTSFLFQAILA